MGSYHYRAIDADGKPVEGRMAAPDLAQLEQRLQNLGLLLVRTLDHPSRLSTPSPTYRPGKVTSHDLMVFSTHMHTLLDAGIPLAQGLKILSQETSTLSLQPTLRAILKQIEAGNTFHEAMRQHPRVFPPQMTNLVQAGEESGTLNDSFKELERYLDWMDQIRGDLRQATIYPAIAIMAVIGLLTLLFTFVIPRFVPIFQELNIALPPITMFVIGISNFMASAWWIWAPIILAVPMAWGVLRKISPGISHWHDRMVLRLPFLGEIVRMITLSKFVQNFAVLYRADIPVLQCLQLCGGLVGNYVVEKALKDTQRAVTEGQTIHESLSRHPVFPPMVIQMISVGETTGTLPQTLMNVANFYNREIPRRVKKIFAIFEPVITLALILIVGMIALALFLPMMSLMNGIH